MIVAREEKRHYPEILPYFYIDKNNWEVFVFKNMKITDYHARIIDYIKRIEKFPVDVEKTLPVKVTGNRVTKPKGLLSRFKDFFKR
jgi:hypothetical protein